MKSEAYGILRKFTFTVMICLCLTLTVSGAIMVSNNTEKISFGKQETYVGISFDKSINLSLNDKAISLTIPEAVFDILAVSPAPVSTIYWLAEGIFG
ncbi:MAG: hypothetical protein K5756_00095 [Clostridiales bacterium]|nr:hypothetical protein [Clostridiales bacterium]